MLIAADGLAGRLDDRGAVVNALDQRRGGADDNEAQAGHLVYGKVSRPHGPDGDGERWDAVDIASSRNGFDIGDTRAIELTLGGDVSDDPLLPLGLDSARYRCCGNGVVSDVSEWIGYRLASLVMEAAA